MILSRQQLDHYLKLRRDLVENGYFSPEILFPGPDQFSALCSFACVKENSYPAQVQ